MTKKMLVPMIAMLMTASVSAHLFAEPAQPMSTAPVRPSCTLTTACPVTYGARDMTLSCGELSDFYISNSVDGALYSYQLDAYSMSRPSETYEYDTLFACGVGANPQTWPQACVAFPTYYPASTWCGPQPTHVCPKNEGWCGDDEGCRHVCGD